MRFQTLPLPITALPETANWTPLHVAGKHSSQRDESALSSENVLVPLTIEAQRAFM